MNSRMRRAPFTLPSHQKCIVCEEVKEIGCFRIIKDGWRAGCARPKCKSCTFKKRGDKRRNVEAYQEWRNAIDS